MRVPPYDEGKPAIEQQGSICVRNMSEVVCDRTEEIGSGSFGFVYAGILKERKGAMAHPEIEIAEKVLKTIPDDEHSQQAFARECGIAEKWNHFAVLKVFRWAMRSSEWVMITLRMRQSLKSVIYANDLGCEVAFTNREGCDITYDSQRRAICIIGTAAALAYCHSNNVLHRDVKPENIMLDDDMRPVLVDFGLSRYVPKCVAADDENDTQPLDATRGIGTPLYMAPELWGARGDPGDPGSEKIDVFAFGVTICELMSNTVPFNGKYNTKFQVGAAIMRHERPEISDVTDSMKELIELCWHPEQDQRPTMEEVLNRLIDEFQVIFDTESMDDQNDLIAYIEKVQGGMSQ